MGFRDSHLGLTVEGKGKEQRLQNKRSDSSNSHKALCPIRMYVVGPCLVGTDCTAEMHLVGGNAEEQYIKENNKVHNADVRITWVETAHTTIRKCYPKKGPAFPQIHTGPSHQFD